jgi:hypothetical protein
MHKTKQFVRNYDSYKPNLPCTCIRQMRCSTRDFPHNSTTLKNCLISGSRKTREGKRNERETWSLPLSKASEHNFSSQNLNLTVLIPQILLSTSNSEPRNHTNHAGPSPNEPGAHTIAAIREGNRGIPDLETLDLAAPSPKRRNPSSARRGPAGASGYRRGRRGGHWPRAEPETSPAEVLLTAGGRAPKAPARLRRRGRGRAEGMGGGGEPARERETANFSGENFEHWWPRLPPPLPTLSAPTSFGHVGMCVSLCTRRGVLGWDSLRAGVRPIN